MPMRPPLPSAPLAPVLLLFLGCGTGDSPTSPVDRPEPATVLAAAAAVSWRQLSAGDNHTCAVTTDSRAYCWGINLLGQLGDGTTGTGRYVPAPVAGDHRFRQISAGYGHTCAVDLDDRAWCWGQNGGALGDKTVQQRLVPVLVRGGHRWRDVRAGFSGTCGVTLDNAGFCWGPNWFGQLGDGTTTTALLPRRVSGGLAFRRIVAGAEYACGTTTAGKAYCWGRNFAGRLGDGTTQDRRVPTAVRTGQTFKNVSAGSAATCGTTGAAAIYCWGDNTDGELGNGTTTPSARPVLVHTTGLFDGVSPGTDHACGLRRDGRLFCWGDNTYGMLGDGTRLVDRLVPVRVLGEADYAQVSAGHLHTCGITTAGVALCWGHNQWGQLGNGGSSDSPVPVAVVGPS